MTSHDAMCATPDAAACWSVPAEFVRLRYFFGQRLGVVDLSDEQSFFVGKQRFHNLRGHGAGVLCGLAAERYVFPAGSPAATPTTALLVRRGAALDACGREVIVGWDQCIDVAAWFAKHVGTVPGLDQWPDPTFTGDRRLWICLRYRECPTDPMPAPRDPCGCDTAGCELGRVREGFELSLITADELADCVARTLPSGTSAPVPIESLAFDAAIRAHWTRLAAGACVDPGVEPCLCLASFTVTFTAGVLTDLSLPDNGIAERLTLLSTALLQETLLGSLAAEGNDAFLGPGPRLTGLRFAGTAADAGSLLLDVALVSEGPSVTALAPSASGPPASAFTVTLRRFLDDGTWQDETALLGPIAWSAVDRRFAIAIASGLVDGARYRLDFEVSATAPVVDMRMRPLGPRRFARHFRLAVQAGTIALSPTLFDT
jgi:hypothetical protein